MNPPDQTSAAIAELMHRAAALDERQARVARDAFLARVERERPRVRTLRVVHWAAPLAVAAAVVTAVVAWPSAGLDYTVSGAADEGGYIRATADRPARVEFSDATAIAASPGSRLRVVETRPAGARVSVERGRLAVRVTHTAQSAWSFVAGPFQVRVTGTAFDLEWNPETEQLTLELREGSVEVAGLAGSGPVTVRAGQRFVGDARTRTLHMNSAQAPAPSAAAPAAPKAEPEPAAPPGNDGAAETDVPAEGVAAAPATSRPGDVSWSKLVARGEFRRVVQAANERGVDSCLSGCGAADLGALADAARYTGQNDLAQSSLLALRRRFPGAPAVRAAFLLGRLYEGQNAHGKALGWYETALEESPSGAFAAECLAGKMRTVNALRGKAAAAGVARQYLDRYPRGVHAAAARQLLPP